MRIKLLFILGFMCLAAALTAQRKPVNFPEKTTAGDNDAIYSQEDGADKKIKFSTARKYFLPSINTIATAAPDSTGNTLYLGQFIQTPGDSIYYVDGTGRAVLIFDSAVTGGGNVNVYEIATAADTTTIVSPNEGDLAYVSDSLLFVRGSSWLLFQGRSGGGGSGGVSTEELQDTAAAIRSSMLPFIPVYHVDSINAALQLYNWVQIGRSRSDTIEIDLPIKPRSNQHITVMGYIRNAPGDSIMITRDVSDGDEFIVVEDASEFRVGQWVSVVPGQGGEVQAGGIQTRFVGATGEILSISGDTLFTTELQGHGGITGPDDYTVDSLSYVGQAQSVFLLDSLDNVIIDGDGVIDQNWEALIDLEGTKPISTDSRIEEVRAQCGISINNCTNVKIKGVTVKNAGLHNVAVYLSDKTTIKDVVLQNAHDKNLLSLQSFRFIIDNIRIEGSLFEDGISLYSGANESVISNIHIKDCNRHGFWTNTLAENVVTNNIYIENCKYGFTDWGQDNKVSNLTVMGGDLTSYMTYLDGADGLRMSNFTLDGNGADFDITISLVNSDNVKFGNGIIRNSTSAFFAPIRIGASKHVSFKDIDVIDCEMGHEVISTADSLLFDNVDFINVVDVGTQDTVRAEYISCQGLEKPTFLNGISGAGLVDGDKGDITVTGSTWTINDDAVTMSKIDQAGATSGQVIKWNGSAWAPDDDTGGTSPWTEVSGEVYYSGNVGIGITNPTARLDVRGGDIYCINSGLDARALMGEGLGGSQYGGFKWNASDNTFRLGATSSLNDIVINSDGYVGINTNSPTASLEILSTEGVLFPRGTTAQRPTNNLESQFRYNLDYNRFEYYVVGSSWQQIQSTSFTPTGNFSSTIISDAIVEAYTDATAYADANDAVGVSSVGLSMPSIFTVSNSPVTASGTLTASLATQSANTVLAGPVSGGDAAPTFRALVDGDLPQKDYMEAHSTGTNRYNHIGSALALDTLTSSFATGDFSFDGSAFQTSVAKPIRVTYTLTANLPTGESPQSIAFQLRQNGSTIHNGCNCQTYLGGENQPEQISVSCIFNANAAEDITINLTSAGLFDISNVSFIAEEK